jgi:hypothetical protein
METRAGEFFVNFAQNNKYLRQKLWVSPLMNQFKSITVFPRIQDPFGSDFRIEIVTLLKLCFERSLNSL